MRKYLVVKNIMLGSAVVSMYYGAVLADIEQGIRIFGTLAIFCAVTALLNEADKEFLSKRQIKKLLTEEKFDNYKKWILAKIEDKTSQGADKEYLESLIINFVLHEKRYQFKSSQILELLDMANECQQKSA